MISGKEKEGEIKRRILFLLRLLGGLYPSGGAQISRLEHSLQLATRVKNAGYSDELIVAGLIHDIGHIIPHCNHADVAAKLLKPYVGRQVYDIVRWHTIIGQGHPPPQYLVNRSLMKDFVHWDIISWDPDYPANKLEDFELILEAIFFE